MTCMATSGNGARTGTMRATTHPVQRLIPKAQAKALSMLTFFGVERGTLIATLHCVEAISHAVKEVPPVGPTLGVAAFE